MQHLHNTASQFNFLKNLERLSDNKIKREHFLIMIVCIIFIFTLTSTLGAIITSTFGIIIPLRDTLIILKQVNPKPEQLKHLLVFWLFFGVLSALDAYSHWLVSLIPFFYTFKLVFLLWAGPFRFNAGEILYEKVLHKVPEKYYMNEGIEKAIKEATTAIKDKAEQLKKKGSEIKENSEEMKKVEDEVKKVVGKKE